jgi:2-polyprenyl-3-methyl-5-hydroxy-6-metoxy-1,4-benzoquinol methylase
VNPSDEVRQSGEVAPDDWDHHWDAYGEAAEGNPANLYRRKLILSLLGQPLPGESLLDIGSGQGEFAIAFKKLHPQTDVWGVEYSTRGVMRSRQAATAAGVVVRFVQRDLLQPVELEAGQPAASYAVCSEVLEHVAEPTVLIRHALSLLAPGAKLVVTVPGGPRSAFDRHIGHYRHFKASTLRSTLADAGLQVERVLRAGFPAFNLYKLAVIVRGKQLIKDVESRPEGARPSRAEGLVSRFFNQAFRANLDDHLLGWQLAAVARVPDQGS